MLTFEVTNMDERIAACAQAGGHLDGPIQYPAHGFLGGLVGNRHRRCVALAGRGEATAEMGADSVCGGIGKAERQCDIGIKVHVSIWSIARIWRESTSHVIGRVPDWKDKAELSPPPQRGRVAIEA